MDKYLIWGTGKRAEGYLGILNYLTNNNLYKIVAFVDNDKRKWGGQFNGFPIISPNEIYNVDYDYISVCSVYENEIKDQIINNLNISSDKIKGMYSDFINNLCEKYKYTEDVEIQRALDLYRYRGFPGIYSFKKETEYKKYELHYDTEKQLSYIIFEGKRMYMTRDFSGYTIEDGKKIVSDIWYEQDNNSPHRYEKGDVSVRNGDILVDCGVCEGNFSLYNIDKVSKVYLVECDPNWIEALHYTFAPYKDKVVFCESFLSNKDTDNTITLDSLIKEKVNFIKMDIEGEEVNALNGARRLLKESDDIRCAICAYHRHDDEKEIKNIFNDYNMECSVSDGYMLFLCDESIWSNPELRRGIVRAKKR